MTDPRPVAKKLRLSLPTHNQQLILRSEEGQDENPSADIIRFFAERGSRANTLQRANLESDAEIKKLKASVQAAQQEIALLKVLLTTMSRPCRNWLCDERRIRASQIASGKADTPILLE